MISAVSSQTRPGRVGSYAEFQLAVALGLAGGADATPMLREGKQKRQGAADPALHLS